MKRDAIILSILRKEFFSDLRRAEVTPGKSAVAQSSFATCPLIEQKLRFDRAKAVAANRPIIKRSATGKSYALRADAGPTQCRDDPHEELGEIRPRPT